MRQRKIGIYSRVRGKWGKGEKLQQKEKEKKKAKHTVPEKIQRHAQLTDDD